MNANKILFLSNRILFILFKLFITFFKLLDFANLLEYHVTKINATFHIKQNTLLS